jgi:hypothetical protein
MGEYKTLGHHVCICIPEYVVSFIWSTFPNPYSICTGFCDADEDCDDDINNKSFESVIPESVHRNIIFTRVNKSRFYFHIRTANFSLRMYETPFSHHQ